MGKATGGTTQQQNTQQQNSTNTVNTGPWQPQQAPLMDAFNQAQAQYPGNAAKTYYPGSTVAPINGTQNSAFDSILGINNQNVPAAQAQNLKTINGDYLNSNPYIDATFNQAGDAVKRQYMTGTSPQTAGAMAAQGRYGSGSYANLAKGNEITYGKTLNDLATNIYGGNYANERQLQQGAVAEAPALAQAAYIDPLAHLAVGNQRQAQTQAEITGNVNAYNYNRDQPQNALNTYLSQIQGNYGQNGTTTGSMVGSGTTQTPYYSNPMASMLGGGLGLASLFSGGANSAANGIGGMAGSAAGGLGSLFGKGGGAGIESLAALPAAFL